MSTTPIYSLTEWAAAQMSPWLPHNAALRAIEAVGRGQVSDRDLADAPAVCDDGECFLVDVGSTPGDPWDGHAGEMAVAVGVDAGNGWLFVAIGTEGQILWVVDEAIRIEFVGGAWSALSLGGAVANPTECLVIACSDEVTALTASTGKVTLRMPYAFTLSDVRASLTTAQTSGSILTVDINESGTSILSTKLTIDNTEKTSTTAAAAAVISDASLADDAEITIDIDQVGDGTAKGLKVYLIGQRT